MSATALIDLGEIGKSCYSRDPTVLSKPSGLRIFDIHGVVLKSRRVVCREPGTYARGIWWRPVSRIP